MKRLIILLFLLPNLALIAQPRCVSAIFSYQNVARFSVDKIFQQDCLQKIYHTIKPYGANALTKSILANCKAQYVKDTCKTIEGSIFLLPIICQTVQPGVFLNNDAFKKALVVVHSFKKQVPFLINDA